MFLTVVIDKILKEVIVVAFANTIYLVQNFKFRYLKINLNIFLSDLWESM